MNRGYRALGGPDWAANYMGPQKLLRKKIIGLLLNKCSAVAEMGDRVATIYMGAVPLFGGAGWELKTQLPPKKGTAGSPFNTMGPGPLPTSVPSAILIHPAVWPQ